MHDAAPIDEVIAKVEQDITDLEVCVTEFLDADEKQDAMDDLAMGRTILTALQNEKARQGAEPVAWKILDAGGVDALCTVYSEVAVPHYTSRGFAAIPLYAHPPAPDKGHDAVTLDEPMTPAETVRADEQPTHEMTMAEVREYLALKLETKLPDVSLNKKYLAEVARWIGKYDDPPQELIREMKKCLSVFLEEWQTVEGICNHTQAEGGSYCPACHAEELIS